VKKYSLAWTRLHLQRLTRATKPKPFPGKYPTRIAWQGTLKNGEQISYIGKPTERILSRFRFLRENNSIARFWGVEFDKNGSIARTEYAVPWNASCDAAGLRKVYHPTPGTADQFFPVEGVWIEVLRNGKACRVFWWKTNVQPINPADYGFVIPMPAPTMEIRRPATYQYLWRPLDGLARE
jgi:hypothetical protein